MTTKVTAKSVICGGIEAGKSVKFILSQVAKKLPDSKADETHVKHYAGVLVKAGELDSETAASKYGYKPRGAALKKAVDEDAPAKASTKKRSAKAKASDDDGAEVKKSAPKKKASQKSSPVGAAKKPVRSRKKAS